MEPTARVPERAAAHRETLDSAANDDFNGENSKAQADSQT